MDVPAELRSEYARLLSLALSGQPEALVALSEMARLADLAQALGLAEFSVECLRAQLRFAILAESRRDIPDLRLRLKQAGDADPFDIFQLGESLADAGRLDEARANFREAAEKAEIEGDHELSRRARVALAKIK
ncbi:MAG: hypothetical protein AB1725_12410 [Armatimonadota bacterium]